MKKYKVWNGEEYVQFTQEQLDNANMTDSLDASDITFDHIQNREWFAQMITECARIIANTGRKIDSIKLVRSVTNWDLKRSKDFVESL